jgi:hypothetical protein
VKRWIERWNTYWFPTTTTLNLAGARVVAVAAQLFWFGPPLEYHVMLAEKNRHFLDAQPLIRLIDLMVPRDVLFTRSGLTAVYWLVTIAGVLALVGLWTRPAMFLFALGDWFFVSHMYSYGDVHHREAVFALFLVALAFAPSGASLSVDALLRRRRGERPTTAATSELAMWPLKFAHVLLAMTYFSTGMTKLLSGGLAWMNGYTLQNYILSDAITRNIPLGLWVAQQHSLCMLLSIGTVLFEVFFFVSLLVPRIAPLFFLGGILFHTGLYFVAGHPFWQFIMLNAILLLFLDPARTPGWLRRLNALSLGTAEPREARQPS